MVSRKASDLVRTRRQLSGVALTWLFTYLPCLGATSSALDAALEPYTHAQNLVSIAQSRRLNLYCLGSGSPVVILDAGLGSSTLSWRKVHSTLAKRSKVCAYDRAGFGFSDPGPLPRTATELTGDMEALLNKAHIRAPYILVGHSSASLNVRLFADRHLEQVVGMVLVEPSKEFQDQRFGEISPMSAATDAKDLSDARMCLSELKAGRLKVGSSHYADCINPPNPDLPDSLNALELKRQLSVSYEECLLSEYESLGGNSSWQVLAAKRSYGHMPLIVLTAGDNFKLDPDKPDNAAAAERKLWMTMHDEIAALSVVGTNRLIDGAKHNIQTSKPEAVIEAVEEVLAQARKLAAAR